MIQLSPSPVVHLELHTGNLARTCSFYSRVPEGGEIAYRQSKTRTDGR